MSVSCQKKSNIDIIYDLKKTSFALDYGFGEPGVGSVRAAADAGVAHGRAATEPR